MSRVPLEPGLVLSGMAFPALRSTLRAGVVVASPDPILPRLRRCAPAPFAAVRDDVLPARPGQARGTARRAPAPANEESA